jgi:hypothetical protein
LSDLLLWVCLRHANKANFPDAQVTFWPTACNWTFHNSFLIMPRGCWRNRQTVSRGRRWYACRRRNQSY